MTVNPGARRQFVHDYAIIRHKEGRGSDNAEYYRALPFVDLSGRNQDQWTIRGCTYRSFLRDVLAPIENRTGRALDILDLGAGNAWLSYRLAARGHRPVALDIFSDEADGLRAARHYPITIPCIEGEFDHLPVRGSSFDIAIFNASFHYSTDYHRTLAELKRCMRPGGRIVIMDSPLYRRAEHGERMRAERHALFETQYGFRSDALPSREYLDEATVSALGRDLSISWSRVRPWYGLQWAARPLRAYIARRRPPSRFVIFVGSFRTA